MSASPSRCKSCDTPVVWVHTETGRKTLLNAVPDPNGMLFIAKRDVPGIGPNTQTAVPLSKATEEEKAGKRYTSHFATCPDRDQWRGRSRDRK